MSDNSVDLGLWGKQFPNTNIPLPKEKHKIIIKINGKNWKVNNDKGKALIRYGKGLTCPTHINNFVRYYEYDNIVICELCGYQYKIQK